MNRRLVIQIVGKMLFAEAVLMILPLLVSVWYGERKGILVFSAVAAGLIVVSLPAVMMKVRDRSIYAKEGLVIVIMTWVVWSFAGALPFYVGGWIPHFIDAFFETVSGFTTTGASVLSDVESLPHGILFWRCFTHWIGGMGVLLFVMAVVQVSENHAIHIMRAELTGPSVGKIVPRGMHTAKILYGIYLFLTVLEIIFLLGGGMSPFDSVTHAFSTAGTGGFSTKNASLAYYDSAYLDGVVTVFMLLFSINFNIFYFCLARKFLSGWRNSEWKVFLGIVAVATLLVTGFIYPDYRSLGESFRYASFQVASCISTTGFVTANFDAWSEAAKYVLLLTMIIGGCAGATCGGLKVIRVQILWKAMVNEVKKMIHPQTVNRLKMDGKSLEDSVIYGALVYLVLLLFLFGVSVFFLALENKGLETSLTAVIACLNNVGPGFGEVGPVQNYGGLTALSKLVLCGDMLLGRLEIYPVLMLFTPRIWRKKYM